MLAIRPKVCRFKPGQGQWIFKGDKSPSTTSFGGEVKPAVPCDKILWHDKNPFSMKEKFVCKILEYFSPSFSYYATRRLLVTARND
jgi:hypothetical protein